MSEMTKVHRDGKLDPKASDLLKQYIAAHCQRCCDPNCKIPHMAAGWWAESTISIVYGSNAMYSIIQCSSGTHMHNVITSCMHTMTHTHTYTYTFYAAHNQVCCLKQLSLTLASLQQLTIHSSHWQLLPTPFQSMSRNPKSSLMGSDCSHKPPMMSYPVRAIGCMWGCNWPLHDHISQKMDLHPRRSILEITWYMLKPLIQRRDRFRPLNHCKMVAFHPWMHVADVSRIHRIWLRNWSIAVRYYTLLIHYNI